MRTLIHNCRLAGMASPTAWVLIDGERIADIGLTAADCQAVQADKRVDAQGMLLMPGAIDCHVHFREPGLTHKADIATESRAALAGGVTSFIDMPNTRPATTSIEAWRQKCETAARESVINYAFFIGATNDNIDELQRVDYTQVPGVKLFMGSSTGNMLVDDDDAIERLFDSVDAIVAVHAEDQGIISANAERAQAEHPQGVPIALHSAIRNVEACYRCTERAVRLAHKHQRRLHICHLTTQAELSLLQQGPLGAKLITSEVSPHHLLWCDQDYERLGARIKMNPAVKSAADRDALRAALADGLIDMVATDHAPHLLQEKQGDALTAVSGAPMVQFSLPLMLSAPFMSEELVQRTMCENPARIYGIEDRGRIEAGCYADLVLVREVAPYEITDEMVVSKCGWTPAIGQTLTRKVEQVWVNGSQALDHAMPLRFTPKH